MRNAVVFEDLWKEVRRASKIAVIRRGSHRLRRNNNSEKKNNAMPFFSSPHRRRHHGRDELCSDVITRADHISRGGIDVIHVIYCRLSPRAMYCRYLCTHSGRCTKVARCFAFFKNCFATA